MLKWFDETKIGNSEAIYSISHDSLKSLLSTDRFIDYAAEIDYPFDSKVYSVDLLGFCNGLVFLWFNFGDRILLCLWNPATKEYKEIPKSPDDDDMSEISMVAFGYDCKSDDYKILARYDNLVQVYSLRLNLWRRIGNVEYRSTCTREGVLVNGKFHWLAESQDSSHSVVSLDISEEIFNEMQLPNEPLVNEHRFMTLGVFEGCLCVLVGVISVCAEVWLWSSGIMD